MSDIEVCGGNPCNDATTLVETDQFITIQLDRISDAAFSILDERAKVTDTKPGLDSYIDKSIGLNQQSYDALSESRGNTRKLISQYCGQCTGFVEGVCPTFPTE